VKRTYLCSVSDTVCKFRFEFLFKFFCWYWGLNSEPGLAKQVLHHLSYTTALEFLFDPEAFERMGMWLRW
jgi:hypothetical protein